MKPVQHELYVTKLERVMGSQTEVTAEFHEGGHAGRSHRVTEIQFLAPSTLRNEGPVIGQRLVMTIEEESK